MNQGNEEELSTSGSENRSPAHRRRSGRRSGHGHKSRNPNRRRETLGERVNRHFLLAGVICISAILIVAAYLYGHEKARREAAAIASTKTAASSLAATQVADLPSLTEKEMSALTEAYAIRQGGDRQGFLVKLESLGSTEPTPGWLDYERAKAHFDLDDSLAGLALLDAASRKPLPPHPEIANFTAGIRQLGRDTSRALQTLEDALAKNPTSWELRLAQSDILRLSGQRGEGLKSAREAALFADSPVAIAVTLLKALLAGAAAEDAATLETIRSSLAEHPESGHWQIAGAAAAFATDDRETAQRLLEKAHLCMEPNLYRYFISDSAFDFYRLDSQFSRLLSVEVSE